MPTVKGGKSPKRKGTAYEREIVNIAKRYDPEAKRVPLSGAVEGYKGDVSIFGNIWECKRRRRFAITEIGEKALENKCNGVIFRSDRGQNWIMLPLKDWLSLIFFNIARS
jgi:hypothetical protein